MHKFLMIGALALSAAFTTGDAAMAQSFEIGPRGVQIEPGYRERGYERERRVYRDQGVGEREAIGIARSAGMDQMVRITGGRGRVWRVTGVDRRGREIRLVIDDQSGQVLARERE